MTIFIVDLKTSEVWTLVFQPLKMRLLRCLKTMGTNYPVILHHIPEE